MKELFSFESLPQMVASSDLVIEGTVQKVEPGRVVGEGHGAIQFGQVTVSVNRVLFGRIEPSRVVLGVWARIRSPLTGWRPRRVLPDTEE
jgi:hypothetical protein